MFRQIFWAYAYPILIVTLILIQRIILVYILHIWICLVRGVKTLVIIIHIRWVALRIVYPLVSLKDWRLALIKLWATIITVVVICRVVLPSCAYAVVGYGAYKIIECRIFWECLLLLVSKSVKTNILFQSRAWGCGKGIGLCCLYRNLSPLCVCETACSVDRHTALIEFLAVTQHILAHLTKVNIKVATVWRGITLLATIYKWVKEPELHIFYIRRLEIIDVELAHHTAPFISRTWHRTVWIDSGWEIIWTALCWVIRQVKYRQRWCCSIICALVSVRIQLTNIYLTHIVVWQLLQVALDMWRSERAATVCENRVYCIPWQQWTIESAR